MSTYTLTGNNPDHEILVGWDSMLSTYFVHVIDTSKPEDDEDRDVVWVGCTKREILSLVRVQAEVLPFAELTDRMLNQLYTDANS